MKVNKAFVAITWVILAVAWILLALNALLMVRNLIYEHQHHPNPTVLEIAIGHLFQVTMLVLGTYVLSLITWLWWKNKYGNTAIVAAIVVIILSTSLAFLTITPSGEVPEKEIQDTASSDDSAAAMEPTVEPVTGILYSEDKPSVVINGQILQEGDIINGVKVIKIYKDKVEFEKNGKRWMQIIQQAPATESR